MENLLIILPAVFGMMIGSCHPAAVKSGLILAGIMFFLVLCQTIANWGAMFSGLALLYVVAFPVVVLIGVPVGFFLAGLLGRG
ncbi:MAG: hypothetical protein ACE369_08985 [Roseovarius sp.]